MIKILPYGVLFKAHNVTPEKVEQINQELREMLREIRGE